jgi:hypothetical protein
MTQEPSRALNSRAIVAANDGLALPKTRELTIHVACRTADDPAMVAVPYDATARADWLDSYQFGRLAE